MNKIFLILITSFLISCSRLYVEGVQVNLPDEAAPKFYTGECTVSTYNPRTGSGWGNRNLGVIEIYCENNGEHIQAQYDMNTVDYIVLRGRSKRKSSE